MANTIIAFDVGSLLGVAIGLNGKVGAHQTIQLRGENREQKLADAMNILPGLIRHSGASACIYEKPFVRGDAATRLLWGLVGVIEAVATAEGLPVVDATATQVRAHVFNQAHGMKKPDIIKAVTKRLGLSRPVDEHEADAIALLIYALEKVEFG